MKYPFFRRFRTAAGEDCSPFFDALSNVRIDDIPLFFRSDSADFRRFQGRVADSVFRQDLEDDLFDFGFCFLGNDQSRQGRASLTAVEQQRVEAHADRLFIVGPGQDDERRLAAQFHTDTLHGRQGTLGYFDARFRRTRKGNHRDIGIVADGIADFTTAAGDEVEDAFGNPARSKASAR